MLCMPAVLISNRFLFPMEPNIGIVYRENIQTDTHFESIIKIMLNTYEYIHHSQNKYYTYSDALFNKSSKMYKYNYY